MGTAGAVVGRDTELSRLRTLLADAGSGFGGVALLLGDAGIGKSSLANAVARHALTEGYAVAWGFCPEREVQPYQLWATALSSLGGEMGRRALDGRRHASRAELFSGVVETLHRLTEDRPALVVLDDVHRADQASLELLRFVAEQLRGTRLALIAAARDDPLEMPVASAEVLAGLPAHVLRLDLGGLDLAATREVMRDSSGIDLDDDSMRAVYERTGGNPFFTAEVGRLYSTSPRPPGAVDVPTGVTHVLSRRFARLDQMTHHLLEVAAVCGDPDIAVVAAVAGVTEAAARNRLSLAVDWRLLVRADGGLAFAHDLVRETLYAGLGDGARGRLHRATAESGVITDPALLAHHWSLAAGEDARSRAAAHAVAAGDAALTQMAYPQAMRFYSWARAEGAGDAVSVTLGLGQAQVMAGSVEEGRATLRTAARQALDAGRPADAVRAVLAMGSGVGGFEVDLNDPAPRELLDEALRALPAGDSAVRAAGMARLSLARCLVDPPEERAVLAQKAVQMALAQGDPATEAAALAALCDALAGPDHVADRLAAAERMVLVADRAGDAALGLLALRLRLVARLEQGDLAGVDADILAYERRAERLHLPLFLWPVPLWRGMRAQMTGDDAAANEYARRVEELGLRAGSANAQLMAWTLRLALAQGDPGELDRLLRVLGTWEVSSTQWDCCVASITARAGRLDEARVLVDRVMTRGLAAVPKDGEYLELLWQLGEAALILHDRAATEAVSAALRPYAHLWAVDGIGGACFGRVSELLSRLAGEPVADAGEGVFRREERLWHVEYHGRAGVLPHSKGMLDLAVLLASVGRDVHVLDLVQAAGGPSREESGGTVGPVLDKTARTAYRRRLEDLDSELEEATAYADRGRVEKLTTERDFLLAELAGALGLGGRDRIVGDPVDRARKAVTMRIATALRSVDAVHPELARHLRASVSTGRFCRYDPEQKVVWRLT